MQVKTEPSMGALGALLDPDGPTVTVVQLSKTELKTLENAASILEALRTNWDQDADAQIYIDVALAGYTLRDLIEEKGRVEL